MTQGLGRLVAYAFSASGRRRLLEEDFVKLLAHERRWFPPSKVRAFVQAARAQGALRAVGAHALELAPEWQGSLLPLDYRPDAAGLEAEAAGTPSAAPAVSLFRRIVRAWSERTQDSEGSIVAGINELQAETGGTISAEVAAVWWGALRGLDVAKWVPEVEASLRATARRHERPPATGPD